MTELIIDTGAYENWQSVKKTDAAFTLGKILGQQQIEAELVHDLTRGYFRVLFNNSSDAAIVRLLCDLDIIDRDEYEIRLEAHRSQMSDVVCTPVRQPAWYRRTILRG